MKPSTGNFLCLLLLVCSFGVHGQSVETLRKERETLLQEISNTSKLIEEKRTSRETNLRQLQLMNREIRAREELLSNYTSEIEQLDRQIEVNQMLINDYEEDITRIKNEYSRLILDSYKRRGELNELMFLFSSADFKETYLRYRLFKEYSRFRQKQGEVLVESQNKVRGLVSQIKVQKEDKQVVLDSIEGEMNKLQNNRFKKAKTVDKLKDEEQWLQKSLKEKETTARRLEEKIREIIAAESNKVEDVAVSSDFNERTGKLIWPVQNGIVINQFGKHPHPVLPRVTINNNGIDIQTTSGVVVTAVHQGVVSTVVGIPGLNKAVIIRHGKFLTVYANLTVVSVSKGQSVNAGQVLGRLGQNTDNNQNILHFEIWEENRKLDPEQWLLR